MPRSIVGIDIDDDGRSRRKRAVSTTPAGMVPWHGVSTAEHAPNAAKIRNTFHGPTFVANQAGMPDDNATIEPLVEAESATLCLRWVCTKCSWEMMFGENVCMCPGCASCGNGCKMPRKLVGLDVGVARTRSRRDAR